MDFRLLLEYDIFLKFNLPMDQLVIYPMRSTKGIKIDYAVAKEGGLQWKKVGDRTFRLIDAKNGVTLGCKLIPKLLKINLRLDNDTIYFTILGLSRVSVKNFLICNFKKRAF